MSNKILYEPKEGTTGFWGLRGFEERPNITLSCDNDSCEGECGEVCPSIQGKRWELEAYEKRVESCKSNKLEIVNGDEVIGQFRYHTNSETILNTGDLLDIPIGYEFKEEERFIPKPYKKLFSQTPVEAKTESVKVLRLVKTETKDKFYRCWKCGSTVSKTEGIMCTYPMAVRTSGICGGSLTVEISEEEFNKISQPEPEESQTDLWAEIWVSTRTRSMDEMIEHWKNNFTIQRKKQ